MMTPAARFVVLEKDAFGTHRALYLTGTTVPHDWLMSALFCVFSSIDQDIYCMQDRIHKYIQPIAPICKAIVHSCRTYENFLYHALYGLYSAYNCLFGSRVRTRPRQAANAGCAGRSDSESLCRLGRFLM